MLHLEKRLFILLLSAVFIGFCFLLSLSLKIRTDQSVQPKTDVLVVTSFFPVTEIVQLAGIPASSITTIIPPMTEPHDFEPTAMQLASTRNAQIFVYLGLGMDVWAEDYAKTLKQEGVNVIGLHELLDKQDLLDPTKTIDPHFWLDPVLLSEMIIPLSEKLSTLLPNQAPVIHEKVQTSLERLTDLHTFIESKLLNCQSNTVITSHDALSRFGHRYHLNIETLSGVSPEDEPSAHRLAEIAVLAKKQNIRSIFYEDLVNPKLAQTIAHEIGAELRIFDPLEFQNTKHSKNYFDIMENNTNQISQSLLCL